MLILEQSILKYCLLNLSKAPITMKVLDYSYEFWAYIQVESALGELHYRR